MEKIAFFVIICFVFLVVYSWVLYPFFMLLLWKFGRNTINYINYSHECGRKDLSVIIPVKNCEDFIVRKYLNTVKVLEYSQPEVLGEWEIIFISDGSNDTTNQILENLGNRDRGVTCCFLEESFGKSEAQNKGLEQATFPFVLFTDVEGLLEENFLIKALPFFSDPEIGSVGGNIQYKIHEWDKIKSTGIYWKLEEYSKLGETVIGTLVSLCGTAFLTRKSAFKPLDSDTGDDLILPLDQRLEGYKIIYAPLAIAYDEWPSKNFKKELFVRRRITLRNLLGISRRIGLKRIFTSPILWFSLFSHKLLKWVTPYLLFVSFILSFFILDNGIPEFFVFLGLAFLYGWGVLGIIGELVWGKKLPFNFVSVFLWANLGMALGVVDFIRGRKIASY